MRKSESRIRRDKDKAKISKSKKRKLKKLEQKKEEELVLSKSIETLERYKIREDVYSLMWSSKNLGQVETARDKRRREAEFFKAGLELPDSGQRSPKKTKKYPAYGVELDENFSRSLATDGSSCLQFPLPETKVLPDATECERLPGKPICLNAATSSEGDDVLSVKDVGFSNVDLTSPCSEKPMDTSYIDLENNLKGQTNQGNCLSLKSVSSTPVIVHALRPKEVEITRKDLPIVMMEQEIMEAINDHSTVVICGETGCGKTTQVPQFLYEAGFGSTQMNSRRGIIGVTQPRRVAVLATAKRVAFELGLHLGKEVGLQVRHDRRVGNNCMIKFMTDGILLREVQCDFLLKRYSIIILDEAHERSLNTDILIGMLSRVIQQRQREFEEQQKRILSGETIELDNRIYPLKLVLMSATLRVEDFVSGKRIFVDPPPVIEIPTRQYPVTIHFSKRTEVIDYVGQAFKKVMSIHKKLPPGGILVFLTGQREVEYLCQKLRKASREMDKNANEHTDTLFINEEKDGGDNDMEEITEAFEFQGNSCHEITDRFNIEENNGNFSEDEPDNYSNSSEESDLEFFNEDENCSKLISIDSKPELMGDLELDGSFDSLKAAFDALAGKQTSNPNNSIKNVVETPEGNSDHFGSFIEENIEEKGFVSGPMRVLPLYAMLPASAQLRVFEDVKEVERLVVIATNVAETSLTIPGIRYVVDTGREKVKNYNSSNGMETYEIQWISKASAAQRAGRSGRTGPGHCYRLYSSAVFNNIFPDFSSAEILKVPVDGVVLLMKSMHIGKVANFPFPTPPETNALIEAEHCLKILEALDSKGRLTPLGKAMAHYPLSPRHSRILLTVIQIMQTVKDNSRANLVLGYAVAAAAALSLSNPFILQYEVNHNDDKNDSNYSQRAISGESENIIEKEEKSRKKKLKEVSKVYRDKFSCPSSDALTVAHALQCFEISASPIEFCNDCALHYKTMEEMSKLRKQLLQLVFSSRISDLQQEFLWEHGAVEDVERAWRVSPNKFPLLLNEEEILGQAICAGWADRVAKRIKASSVVLDGERKVNAVRYQACMVKETVFLHRWSSVSKSPPEYLIYSELLYRKRPYIHGATSVKSNWLLKYAKPLCTFSAPLSDPKPYYDRMADQVFSWVTPTFGPHLWQLPLHGLPIEDPFNRVVAFACSLLEGQVLPCLKQARKYLAASPSSILKPEARGLKRVGNLLNKLSEGRIIDSCTKLRKLWNEKPTELFPEIRAWFQEKYHLQFEEVWKQMLHQILLDPKKRFSRRTKEKKTKENKLPLC